MCGVSISHSHVVYICLNGRWVRQPLHTPCSTVPASRPRHQTDHCNATIFLFFVCLLFSLFSSCFVCFLTGLCVLFCLFSDWVMWHAGTLKMVEKFLTNNAEAVGLTMLGKTAEMCIDKVLYPADIHAVHARQQHTSTSHSPALRKVYRVHAKLCTHSLHVQSRASALNVTTSNCGCLAICCFFCMQAPNDNLT